MINAIKKAFNGGKGTTEMKDQTAKVELATDELVAQLSASQEALASQSAEFSAVTEQLAKMTQDFQEVKAALDAVETAKKALVKEAHEKKMSLRKEKIVATVGTDKAEALMVATESLEDTQFEAVVQAMASTFVAEADTAMFKEIGVATKEADASKVEEVSSVETALKQKYSPKKAASK